jgi:hypothetical protein
MVTKKNGKLPTPYWYFPITYLFPPRLQVDNKHINRNKNSHLQSAKHIFPILLVLDSSLMVVIWQNVTNGVEVLLPTI